MNVVRLGCSLFDADASFIPAILMAYLQQLKHERMRVPALCRRQRKRFMDQHRITQIMNLVM